MDTAFCYAVGAVMAGLTITEIFPLQVGLINGLACLPYLSSTSQQLIFVFVYFPFLVLFPQTVAFVLGVKIWRSGLLPFKGETRNLFIFFYRIILVFVVVWLPAIILVLILDPKKVPFGVMSFAAIWTHLEGFLCSIIMLFRTDIRSAFLDFVLCRTWKRNQLHEVNSRRPTIEIWEPVRGSSIYRNTQTGEELEMSSHMFTENGRTSTNGRNLTTATAAAIATNELGLDQISSSDEEEEEEKEEDEENIELGVLEDAGSNVST